MKINFKQSLLKSLLKSIKAKNNQIRKLLHISRYLGMIIYKVFVMNQ